MRLCRPKLGLVRVNFMIRRRFFSWGVVGAGEDMGVGYGRFIIFSGGRSLNVVEEEKEEKGELREGFL